MRNFSLTDTVTIKTDTRKDYGKFLGATGKVIAFGIKRSNVHTYVLQVGHNEITVYESDIVKVGRMSRLTIHIQNETAELSFLDMSFPVDASQCGDMMRHMGYADGSYITHDQWMDINIFFGSYTL